MDIDREDPYTGMIDGEVPGQPYDFQWWMYYYTVNLGTFGEVRCKKNIFTRRVYVFTRRPEGNRWNEFGYGWGRWVAI